MKRLLFLGVGSALLFTMGGMGSAQADNGPHSITTGKADGTTVTSVGNQIGADQCANCHRAHTAVTSTLTKQPQPDLCLNCHDGTGSSLNVETGTSNGKTGQVAGALRGGGFTSAEIGSGAASKVVSPMSSTGRYPVSAQLVPVVGLASVTSSHQINGATQGTMWGNGTSGVGQTGITLECGACHDPHGNGNYRMLKPSPDGQQYDTTPAVGTVGTVGYVAPIKSLPTTVNIPDQPCTSATNSAGICTKAYTTVNYWDVQAVGVPLTAAESAVNATAYAKAVANGTTYTAPVTDGFLGGVSAWCTTCHTRYLSTGASVDNVNDAVFTYKHRSDEQASNKPDCIQCHVAHGTDAVMSGAAAGVSAPGASAGSITAGYQNSDLLRVNDRGTCLMCHTMGAPTPLP
jgi:predicted CXXCH cytochrome family protein